MNVFGSDSVGEEDTWIETAEATGSAETRYALPWRPVKPLLIIWDVKQRSAAQREQRMQDTWPLRYLSVGSSSSSETLVVLEETDGRPPAFDGLGRKTAVGRRNLGNMRIYFNLVFLY